VGKNEMLVVKAWRRPLDSARVLAEDPLSVLWGEFYHSLISLILATGKQKLHVSPSATSLYNKDANPP